MHTLLNYLLNIPAGTWYHFGEFMLGGAGISVTIQVLKHLTKLHGHDKLLQALNGGFATLAVAAQAYLAGGAALGPLVKQSAALAAASAVIYRISVSPLYRKFVTIEQKVEAYDTEHRDPGTSTVAATPEAPTDSPVQFGQAPEE